MKGINYFICLTVFSMNTIFSFSQDFSFVSDMPLKTEFEYKEAETEAKKCAEYILDTPFHRESENFDKASSFLLRWMGGTPDYTFNIDGQVARLIEGNEILLSVYLAGMTKFAIENPDKSGNNVKMKRNALESLLEYCDNPNNKIKPKGELKKLIKANQKGKLDDYL